MAEREDNEVGDLYRSACSTLSPISPGTFDLLDFVHGHPGRPHVRVPSPLSRCASVDSAQARLVLPCVRCGARAEAIVHLADLRAERDREARVGEAAAGIRCAACAGKVLS